MDKAVVLRRLTGWLLVLSCSGCSTLRTSSNGHTTEQDATNLAGALADYSMAIRSGMQGDADQVIKHYEAAVVDDPENSAIKTELALIYLHQGQYTNAIRLADEVISLQPRQIKAYQLKALALRITDRYEEALDMLRTAAALQPTNSMLHIDVASMMVQNKKSADAAGYLEQNVKKTTDPVPIYLALGQIYTGLAKADFSENRSPSSSHLDTIQRAAEDYPGDQTLLMHLGDLMVFHGRLRDALAVYDSADNLRTNGPSTRHRLAMVLGSIDDRDKAISLVEANLLAEDALDYRPWLYLAELFEREKPAEAIRCYKKAIGINPGFVESYLRLANLYIKQDDLGSAESVLNESIAQDPNDARPLELRGYLYLREERFTDAVESFAAAENLNHEKPAKTFLKNFYLNAALANQFAGNTDRAAELLRRGASSEPEIIEQFMGLAFRSRNNAERTGRALDVLDKISDYIPQNQATYAMLGLLALNAENYPVALQLLQKAKLLAIESGEEESLEAQFFFWLGSASERNQLYDQAEEYFLEAIRMQPDHSDAHNYLAYMNAERGVKLEEAMDHVSVALAIEPENAAYLDTRGWIYYKMGDYTNALADIQLAFEIVPDDPTITEHLGDIHEMLGENQKAGFYWNKALEIDPGNTNLPVKLKSVGIEPVNSPTNQPAQAPPVLEPAGIAE